MYPNKIMKVEIIKDVLSRDRNIIAAYIYGSAVRGNYTESSDIDIGVLVKKEIKDPLYEAKLSIKIEKKLNKEVEVRVLNNKPLIFLHQVFGHGKLLFSKNEKIRLNFETATINKYFDFLPFIQEYNNKRFERYGIR